jgi:hypothetical protein
MGVCTHVYKYQLCINILVLQNSKNRTHNYKKQRLFQKTNYVYINIYQIDHEIIHESIVKQQNQVSLFELKILDTLIKHSHTQRALF